MTPEEKAVIQAAINDRDLSPALADAVQRLTYSCAECNTDTHRCGGCGENVLHGDYDCGKNCTNDPVINLVPTWVSRTWTDVRVGDHVRLGIAGPSAYVIACTHLDWHIDPRSSEYRPVGLEWQAVNVTFSTDPTPATIHVVDPNKPVEIELSPAEVEAIELIGWSNRVGMIVQHGEHR